jgi:hypothetical protein
MSTELAALAWEATKAKDDPDFGDCLPSFQSSLVSQASRALTRGEAGGAFQTEVLRLASAKTDKPKTPVEVEQKPGKPLTK